MKQITRNDIEYVQQTISKDGSVWTAKYSDNCEYRKQVVSVVLLREVLESMCDEWCVNMGCQGSVRDLVKKAFVGVLDEKR